MMDPSNRIKSNTATTTTGTETTTKNNARRQVTKTRELKKFEATTGREGSSQRDYARRLNDRSRRLTLCLICLVASVSCLSPFLSLHLTQRVGFLLFESDLIQLRASLFSVTICLAILVILYFILFILSDENPKRKGLILQRLFKHLIGSFSVVSAISYLALGLLVPQIKQVQRMPIATFDCNANLITIENCYQQFNTRGGEQSLSEAMKSLLGSDLSSGNNDKLIKRLNCLQYNDDELDSLKVPTRFLLHHCGLVCRPQRQQLHQFGDDLNREQLENLSPEEAAQRASRYASMKQVISPPMTTTESTVGRLVPPYHHMAKDLRQELETLDGTHLIYRNRSSISEHSVQQDGTANLEAGQSSARQVSLRVCFSSDFSTGSNYKQFCITNLADASQNQDHTLTVGQLNAMLRKFTPAAQTQSMAAENPSQENFPYEYTSSDTTGSRSGNVNERPAVDDQKRSKSIVEDQTTHYVNPVVQFESHFKNWPHLTHRATSSLSGSPESDDMSESSDWCQFRPLPPFIVNNKPFNDIQCSLEHEYTMTTGPPATTDDYTGSARVADRIYLKKSTKDESQSTGTNQGFSRERCNIQCKVNILYHVQTNKRGLRAGSSQSAQANRNGGGNDLHYYLPVKPCIVVQGDKRHTAYYYMLFRSLGDSTLSMAFIMLDLFLLLEAIDTKQSQLESKKYRIVGLLVVLVLIPLTVSLLYDLISIYSPAYVQGRSQRDNYLGTFLFDRLLPSIVELFYSRPSPSLTNGSSGTRKPSAEEMNANLTDGTQFNLDGLDEDQLPLVLDGYLLPFFIYAILMFALAINSWSIPLIFSAAPLVRVSSIEELGMSSVGNSGSLNKLNYPQVSKQPDGGGNNNDIKSKTGSPILGSNSSIGKQKIIDQELALKLISFSLLAIFMGFQFNLNHFCQTRILIETFGDPLTNKFGDYTATLFTLITYSGSAFFILSLVLIFANETSTFFANLLPLFITPKTSQTTDLNESKQNQANFLKYISLAQIIYSLRYFALLSLNPTLPFKWLLVFMFQVAEIFNFPIVWFALTSRIHALITRHPAYIRSRALRRGDPAIGTKLLHVHIVAHSALALLYFVIARYLALFIHSVHASIHLHSDNVDWFIYSFYQQKLAPRTRSRVAYRESAAKNVSTNPEETDQRASESLFSPLPGERQTYLHASRLFLKFNSIICLTFGAYFLMNRLYLSYKIWSMQKRTLTVDQQNAAIKLAEDTESQQIDERLSLDLMRIHQTKTRNIYPKPKVDSRFSSRGPDRSQSPRAKILFHYNLGRKDSSNESISSTAEREVVAEEDDDQPSSPGPPNAQSELRIPIAMEEDLGDDEEDIDLQANDKRSRNFLDDQQRRETVGGEPDEIERIVKQRNKRVRIFEDDEEWPSNVQDAVEVLSREPTGIIQKRGKIQDTESDDSVAYTRSNRRPTRVANISNSMLNNGHRKRTISFAPTATLIGHDGTRGRQLAERDMATQYASPEPSIDNDEDSEQEDETS